MTTILEQNQPAQECLNIDATILRKMRQYDKQLEYIKAYNKTNAKAQNERAKKYHAKVKDTEEWKRKKQEYYINVLKPKRQEEQKIKREAKEEAKKKKLQSVKEEKEEKIDMNDRCSGCGRHDDFCRCGDFDDGEERE